MRGFFTARTDARNLAVLRVIVFGSMLWTGYRTDLVAFTRMPAELRVAPTLYEGWMDRIPFDATFATPARDVLLVASAMALAGLFTRCSALVACLAATYVLGLPYFFGKVDHPNHHLIWFAALLSVSRAGDAWSVDAWRTGRSATAASSPRIAYALPIRIAWLLIGVAYFFPGLSKLLAGPQWIFGDNLKYLLYQFWSDKGFLPPLRIDRYPTVYRAGALLTVVIEVGFLPSLFSPRLRAVAAVGGLLFHAATAIFLRITFTGLMLCYATFVDWAAVVRGLRMSGGERRGAIRSNAAPHDPIRTMEHPPIGVALVGGLLLCIQVLCGVLRVNSWPFSIYPQFAEIQLAPVSTRLEVAVQGPQGSRRIVSVPLNRHAIEEILRLPPGKERTTKLRALQRLVVNQLGGLRPTETLDLSEVTRSTLPEDQGRPPMRRILRDTVP